MRIANHVDDPKGVFEPFGETLTGVDTGSVAFNSPNHSLVRCDLKLYMCKGQTGVARGGAE
jgi:hypothetical protein